MFPHQTFIVDNISQKVYLVCSTLYFTLSKLFCNTFRRPQKRLFFEFLKYGTDCTVAYYTKIGTRLIEARICKTVASVEVSCLGAWSNKPKISPISFSNFNSVQFFICSGEKHSPSIMPPKNMLKRFKIPFPIYIGSIINTHQIIPYMDAFWWRL